MKTAISQCILLAFLVPCSVGHCETTNSFRIFLTDDFSTYRMIQEGKADLSRIHLEATPLISETDIISYDISNHIITLKPEALARIPKGAPVYGTPFVVVADGQRIYLGGFMDQISSIALPYPTIMIGPRWTPDLPIKSPKLPTNCLVIDRAYPSPSFGIGPDPRGDPRIKSALKALHKLKNDR